MKVTFVKKEDLNQNVTTFYFKPPEKIKFTAGQFTELYLPHKNADERGEKHWFTISASPTEELLSITTKNAGKKGSSFKRTLWNLEPGTSVNLAEPMGDFVLPKDPNIPLIFVAGGIGVTPFRSMIKWLTDTNEKRDIKFIWALSAPEDAVFMDLFNGYGIDPQLVTKSEGLSLDAKKILEFVGDPKGKRIYISGPEPMVENFTEELEKLGIAKNDMVSDYFPGYLPI